MRILYVTTIGRTMGFFPEHIKMLLSEGHTVELACNNNGDDHVPDIYNTLGISVHDIPFSRSPFSLANLRAYKKFKELIQSEHFDLIHTHTPSASVIARLACRPYRKNGLKVFYTAHGFHFYKGAPRKNWLIYYPLERFCSRWTDVLITINQEDYALAQKKMMAKKVEYISGIGVDIKRFSTHKVSKEDKRVELGIPQDAFILLSVGELASRKNQQVVIDALGMMKDRSIYYLLVGTGELYDSYKRSIEQYGIEDQVRLLGSRVDVDELCDAADVFVHPSVREGLGIAPLEAMASGLPLISSYVNGIKDYTKDGVTGCCIEHPNNTEEMKKAILKMKNDSAFRALCAQNNIEIAKEFDMLKSVEVMSQIYRNTLIAH